MADSKEIRHKTCGQTHFNCKCGAYKMPYGKFYGKTLDEINQNDGGREYLEWMQDAMAPRVYTDTRDWIVSFLMRFP